MMDLNIDEFLGDLDIEVLTIKKMKNFLNEKIVSNKILDLLKSGHWEQKISDNPTASGSIVITVNAESSYTRYKNIHWTFSFHYDKNGNIHHIRSSVTARYVFSIFNFRFKTKIKFSEYFGAYINIHLERAIVDVLVTLSTILTTKHGNNIYYIYGY